MAVMEPLLPGTGAPGPVKKKGPFGWWPLWQEVVPLDDDSGSPDKALVIANIGAGVMIGIRQGLSAIMTASLIFTSAGVPQLSDMFGIGISMMWFSSTLAAFWYGLFGRMQFGLIGINDVIGILWGTMGTQVGFALADEPSKIAPTQLAIIAVSTVLTGIASILFGQLGLGKLMLLFPAPVTSGFLGSIGLFIFKSSLQISSGVKFHYLWPLDWGEFCQMQPLARVACMFAALAFMRQVPPLLVKTCKGNQAVKKLGGLICQLLPLLFFYLGTWAAGIGMDTLTEEGWTYPKQGSGSPLAMWTTYSFHDADWHYVMSTVPRMGLIVMMSVLCTMTGVLGISGKFPEGPKGDPAPQETIDYNRELLTAGWADIILGLAGGIITFHRLGSTVQLRGDGGTHRLAVLTCGFFCGGLFLSGVPIGHVIPTWFLGALFMNSCIGLMQDALLSYKKLPPSDLTLMGKSIPHPEYAVTLVCIVVAVAESPFSGIATGLVLSIFIFLYRNSESEPVSGVISGNLAMSHTKRPSWEMQVLRQQGHQIILLFLQGQLFFGSADHISRTLATATEDGTVKYCVLSCARVISIDASAARQVKASVEKASRSGVKVLFCRMNAKVYEELFAAGAFKHPDQALQQSIKVEEHERAQNRFQEHQDFDQKCNVDELGIPSQAPEGSSPGAKQLQRKKTYDFVPIGADSRHDLSHPDAFDTESDALDFCSDFILQTYCYDQQNLEDYKKAYRLACKEGKPLELAAFEAMNFMKPGTMMRLKGACQEMTFAHYGRDGKERSKLPSDEPTLFFIMRGAIAQVEKVDEQIDAFSKTSVAAKKMHAEVKGFAGRGGNSRLRVRYTPGHVVGKTGFFVRDGLVDKNMLALNQISSRIAGYTEVWALPRSRYDALPDDLQKAVQDLMLFQMADDRQHALLME
eukprot:TRINITY_DN64657_c0_g1_i1.p1 TRINITY_DN64657_c0_g1~~TRINITY_DN64657_c0_g1_i1.p1  ORF type:complete len:919 (-),score=196.64 TRINITY_DN64657_c0_g1_i1:6-2762(-)